MARQYTYRDLIQAYLSRLLYSQAHPDLVRFHGGRFAALSRLFGLPEAWAEAPAEALPTLLKRMDTDWIMDLFRRTAAGYNRGMSPFGGYLETPAGIGELYRKFGRRIGAGEELVRAALLDLMGDIFVSVFGKADLAFASSDLLAIGFDDAQEPDPIDYW